MNLIAGRIESDHTLTPGSMAAEIERALNDLVKVGANEDPLGRRKLALAIARGVLKHLHDNAGAVEVTVPDAGGANTHQQSPTIGVDLGGWS
jgi:hypothetical protein